MFDWKYQVTIEEIILGQTNKMSMSRGLKEFGGYRVDARAKRDENIYERGVHIPVQPRELSRVSRTAHLK